MNSGVLRKLRRPSNRRDNSLSGQPINWARLAALVGGTVLVVVLVAVGAAYALGVFDDEADEPQASAPATPAASATPANDRVQVSVSVESRFGWPAFGSVVTYFGPRHPEGIDISLERSEDDRVYAAADGLVLEAGGDPCCDYGFYVVLAHDGGFTSYYGHLAGISVRQGEGVLAGDVLGTGGSTGLARGRHLHFELRGPQGPVDPLEYLPAAPRAARPVTQQIDCTRDPIVVEQASFTRVVLSGSGIAGYDLSSVNLTPQTAAATALTARREAGLTLVIEAPPGVARTGAAERYTLEANLTRSNASPIKVECEVEVEVAADQAPAELAGPTDSELVRAARAAQEAQAQRQQEQGATGSTPASSATGSSGDAPANGASGSGQAPGGGVPAGPPPPVPTAPPTPRPTLTPTATPTPRFSPTPTRTPRQGPVIGTPVRSTPIPR